ncbi:flavin-containing monooxygenase [Aspergillus saccharolyticus JOP 1030-1]|uniref:FAD/NAD(P)-binding domain-containing protein n=1 Tax=Aspergillus saccharolyticus JOP 1030-1 TaxID=1450539 RepID=A0A318Z4K2_9EURO|nr:FAD/NAD(P)-binding domain-containing protein [Aspergillus saccharolyticus JOP 1030-1]PYH42251.1 FAD/NAD(P)-binding domain-containing protein [Aspergillus saccharolyticus JOP 1030-1]
MKPLSQPPYHHIIQLPTTPEVDLSSLHPVSIGQEWLSGLNSYLVDRSAVQLSQLFHEDCWWRDMLALDWEFHTLQGFTRVRRYLEQHLPKAQLQNAHLYGAGAEPAIETPQPGLTWITATFAFETRAGHGRGVFYLTPTQDGDWKAYSVYTALQGLRGVEEQVGLRRPFGTIDSMRGGISQGNWLERRQRDMEFNDTDPTVLIVGAGQAGLNLAVRLQTLGQSCLIVEKNYRVGDNWRQRYRTLITHDHIETCHLAHLPFPKTWPKYLPKDKLADWLESYATIMELNVWTQTEIKAAEYDQERQQWTVSLVRDGVERILRPHHMAWCAGHLGLPLIPSFPGQSQFEGQLYHASQHVDARQLAPHGKKVVVVGTGNSGHDIAQDFYDHGASVTMLQRGPTYVLTEKHGLPLLPENHGIDDNRTPIEEQDILSESLPWPVTLALCVDLTQRISAADEEVLRGLRAVGFQLDFGLDGAGLLRSLVTRGGGYYIDFGCSRLLIEGKIQLQHCAGGIASFDTRGLHLADGRYFAADIVVLATGYANMRESVRRTLGDLVADQCKDVWDLDEEGEIQTIWRPSGHPNLWLMGGSLSLCRIYSRFIALQIVATELGLMAQ